MNFQVGHSLGGHMASLCSIVTGVHCVTFESLGSLDVMLKHPHYRECLKEAENSASEVRIINYFAAPNVINTLHRHAGRSFRLYLPLRGSVLNWCLVGLYRLVDWTIDQHKIDHIIKALDSFSADLDAWNQVSFLQGFNR